MSNSIGKTSEEKLYRWTRATKENIPEDWGMNHWRDFKTKAPVTAGLVYRMMRLDKYDTIEWLEPIPASSTSAEGEESRVDSQEFYEIAYRYRFADVANQEDVVRRFEILKKWVKDFAAIPPASNNEGYYKDLAEAAAEVIKVMDRPKNHVGGQLVQSNGNIQFELFREHYNKYQSLLKQKQ